MVFQSAVYFYIITRILEIASGVKRFSFCDFDDEAHEFATAWSEEGNQSGCKKMLEKLNAKEFAGVLKEMKDDLEDAFFSEHFAWIKFVIEHRDSRFSKNVLDAFHSLLQLDWA